jgi:hypothetical protein
MYFTFFISHSFTKMLCRPLVLPPRPCHNLHHNFQGSLTGHFCTWFLQSVRDGLTDSELAFFSGKVPFALNESCNTGYNTYWST